MSQNVTLFQIFGTELRLPFMSGSRNALSSESVGNCFPAAPMALLEVLKGGRGNLPESFAILKTRTTLGRDAKCDVTLEWDGISRVHAEIEGVGSDVGFSTGAGGRMHTAFRIKDCGSSNGVFVNNVKVVESVLRDGDTVSLGRGRAMRTGEAAPERYFEYIFVFRTLKLRGQSGGQSHARGGRGSDAPVQWQIHPPCKSHLYCVCVCINTHICMYIYTYT